MARSRSKNQARKFPYTAKDDKAMEEGDRVRRARYFQGLRRDAAEILADATSGGELDEARLDELIHQTADNRVIYTQECILILLYSDNFTAISDEGVSSSTDDIAAALCEAAYYAYRQDLSEMVEARSDEFVQ